MFYSIFCASYQPVYLVFKDNEYLHQSAEDDIILYNVELNYLTTIMTNSTMVRTFPISKKIAKRSFFKYLFRSE